MTGVPRRPVRRRDWPKQEDLAAWRDELNRWGWSLFIGTGGYWYAESPDGLERFTDRQCRRTYLLAIAAIARSCGNVVDALRHEAEAHDLKLDDITGGIQ